MKQVDKDGEIEYVKGPPFASGTTMVQELDFDGSPAYIKGSFWETEDGVVHRDGDSLSPRGMTRKSGIRSDADRLLFKGFVNPVDRS